MATLKRSNTCVAAPARQTTPLKRTVQRRATAVMSPPIAQRVGAMTPFIVVVSHNYPVEYASNAFGQARGLGNTFTLEVVATDAKDATDTVERMLAMDFSEADMMDIVSVTPAPGVDYYDGHGRTVSVLSSRHCAIYEGHGPYEELFNAVRDNRVIEARGEAIHPMTVLETRVTEAFTGAMIIPVPTIGVGELYMSSQ